MILRNGVPVAGVLFLHWPPEQQLVLYFADTLLALVVLFALGLSWFFPVDNEDGVAARVNAAGGVFGSSLFVVAFLAIPLGMPLLFVLSARGFALASLLQQGFLMALGLHVTLAVLSFVAMYREMRGFPDPGTAIKRQLPWTLFRWVAVILAVYTGIPLMLGWFGGLLLVAIYAAAGIAAELRPRALVGALDAG
jgi:hypothetical protein